MIRKIRTYWDEQPLILILGSAILFRLIAVIFARGWGMLDDHFLVIEASQSWVDGHDYNSWLPGSDGNHGPTGHNLFYPGLHFLLFSFLKMINITDPQVKMITAAEGDVHVVRGHALSSGNTQPHGVFMALTLSQRSRQDDDMTEIAFVRLLAQFKQAAV